MHYTSIIFIQFMQKISKNWKFCFAFRRQLTGTHAADVRTLIAKS